MPPRTLTRGMCLSSHDLDPTKLEFGICDLSLPNFSHNKLEINDYAGDRDGGVALPGISGMSVMYRKLVCDGEEMKDFGSYLI